MKVINTTVRPRFFFKDYDTSKTLGQSRAEKRISHRSERARLKMSLVREIHGSAAAEAKQLGIEHTMDSQRLVDDLMRRIMAIEESAAAWGADPFAKRHRRGVWAYTPAGRVLIASCDCV